MLCRRNHQQIDQKCFRLAGLALLGLANCLSLSVGRSSWLVCCLCYRFFFFPILTWCKLCSVKNATEYEKPLKNITMTPYIKKAADTITTITTTILISHKITERTQRRNERRAQSTRFSLIHWDVIHTVLIRSLARSPLRQPSPPKCYWMFVGCFCRGCLAMHCYCFVFVAQSRIDSFRVYSANRRCTVAPCWFSQISMYWVLLTTLGVFYLTI